MPETMKPQFKHDCDACVLLFVTSSKDDVKRDVYYCPKSDQGTILIRWGDAPGSYASTPVSTIVTNIRHYAFDPMDTTLRGFLTAWGQGLIKMDIRKPDPLIDVPSWWIGYTKASDEIDNLRDRLLFSFGCDDKEPDREGSIHYRQALSHMELAKNAMSLAALKEHQASNETKREPVVDAWAAVDPDLK